MYNRREGRVTLNRAYQLCIKFTMGANKSESACGPRAYTYIVHVVCTELYSAVQIMCTLRAGIKTAWVSQIPGQRADTDNGDVKNVASEASIMLILVVIHGGVSTEKASQGTGSGRVTFGYNYESRWSLRWQWFHTFAWLTWLPELQVRCLVAI